MMPFGKTLTQKSYNKVIDRLQFHQLTCTCGMSGCMTVHGYYGRTVKTEAGDISLTVCRVRCSHCGRTHALLPSLLVPYSQVPLEDQAAIITSRGGDRDYSGVMERVPSIDENLVGSIIRRYVRHWEQKLRSFRISLSPPGKLVEGCFSHFMMQFMQIRQTPNTLFAATT